MKNTTTNAVSTPAIETKISANGTRLYYANGKKVSRAIALEVAAQNRVGNPFTIEVEREMISFHLKNGISKSIYTSRDTYTELNTRIHNCHGYTLYIGTHEIHTFHGKNLVKELLAKIEDAFINGEHGVKVALDGKISILPADEMPAELGKAEVTTVEVETPASVAEPTDNDPPTAPETDGSEEDADDNDEVFNLLPDFKADNRKELKLDADEEHERDAEQLPMPKVITAIYNKRCLTVKLDGRRVPLQFAVEDAVSERRREPVTVINAQGEIFTYTKHIKELRIARACDGLTSFVKDVAKGIIISDKEVAELRASYAAGKHIADKVSRESKPIDNNDEVFNALPSVDELNDVDGEFDEYAAEDTDRDARFNHGERHAAALTKKLAEFDPTVEVIYDIDDEGEDVFYLRYDGIYRTPFGTLDGVEVSFHVMKEDGVGNRDDEPKRDFVITDPTILPPNEESFITRDYCDKINVNAPDGWEIRYVGERKTSGSKFTNAVLYIFHNNRFVTEFKGLLSSKFVKNPAAFFATFDAPEPVDDEPQGWIVPVEMPARKLNDLEIADLLTDRLYKVTNKTVFNGGNYMDVTLQNGKKTAGNVRTAIVEPNWHGNGFVFITPWNEVYARYDTADEVAHVIELIGTAVKRGDKEFTYPADEPSEPDNAQKRAIDLDVYHVDSNLTDEELADYTSKLREALTANGNRGVVTCEDNLIAVIGNGGGDSKRLSELLNEMSERGCAVEVVDTEADKSSEMTGEEFDTLVALGTNVPAESVDIPAPVTVEVPTPEFVFNVARFNDDFIAKRDELKANVRIAQDALIVAQDNFDAAKDALRKFFNKAAYELCNELRQAQATLGDRTIIIERQCGLRRTVDKDTDIYIDVHGGEMFAFVDGNDKTIARYDTPAQVKAVIRNFKAAITNGDKLFTFPTVEELNA